MIFDNPLKILLSHQNDTTAVAKWRVDFKIGEITQVIQTKSPGISRQSVLIPGLL